MNHALTASSRFLLKIAVVRRQLVHGAAGLLLLASASAGRVLAQNPGPYSLDAGDLLELAVIGLPDLRQRLTIDLNGNIQVPLVGDVRAAGRPLAEVQDDVREALSSKYYRQRLPDGRDAQIVISRDEVALRIVDYRPIYLSGDVSRPGEQQFRPNMTVLQAISMGGGYDIQRFRMANPLMESAELRGDIRVLRVELLRTEVRRQRLEAELTNTAGFEPRPVDIPLPLALVQGILRTEVQQFEARRSDYQAQLDHLRRLQEQTDAKLESLVEQLRREDEGTLADQEEANRLRDLVQRGVASTARAVETRRNSLLSATRALQTRVQVEQSRKEQEEIGRRIEQFAAQRRDDVLREIQEGNVQLAVLQARHGAVSERIFYSSVLRSQLVRGRGGRPEITIVRRTAEGRNRTTANENSELLPGDVVEVTLRLEHLDASEPSSASAAPPQ